MKKILFALSLVFMLVACEDDVAFNNPTFQVYKDNTLIKTRNPRATLNSNGSLVISGKNSSETLTLTLASSNPGTYTLGLNSVNAAYYTYNTSGLTLEYSTLLGITNPQLEDGLGKVIIYGPNDPRNGSKPNTISGEFYFRGRLVNDNPFGTPTIFFHKGNFYNVRVLDQPIP